MAQSVGQVALDIVVGKDEVSGKNGALSKLGGVASGVGKAVGTGMAAVGTGIAAAGAGILAIGKQAVSSYAEYEQLTGGVETLFKGMADTVIENANNAYKTAGMSANEYMQTVTSFSASLLQSLNGNTQKAAEYADMAIRDMSDNANKMGTSMEMIQNAYQGFAKQNYTMLDNLKLGYGGTKEEMQRLLEDASAIAGIDFDISSYADVVQAINVIQTEMGITGTTAKEAGSTIQGSIASMGAAWNNLLTGLTDPTQNFDKLFTNFIDSVSTAMGNLVPKITTTLNGIVKMISSLAPIIIAEVPNLVSTILPPVLEGAISIVSEVIEILPSLFEMITEMLPSLIEELLSTLTELLPQLITGLVSIFEMILEMSPSLIKMLLSTLTELLPQLITGLVSIIVMLCDNFAVITQPIIDNLPVITMSIVNGLMDNLPQLVEGIINLTIAVIAQALPQIIMVIIECIPLIIESVVIALMNTLPILISGVAKLFGAIIPTVTDCFMKIPNIFGTALESTIRIVSAAIDKIKSFFEFDWSLPKLKMPHFEITGKFSLDPPSVPRLGVEWYNKAMNGGMILNGATIFGMGRNGQLLGGGETGSETVVGTSSLLTMIRSAVADMMSSRVIVDIPALNNVRAGSNATEQSDSKIDRLIELFEKFLSEDNGDITVPIYIGNERIDEYIVNKNSRQRIRSGGHA